jgi:hypothetical protein
MAKPAVPRPSVLRMASRKLLLVALAAVEERPATPSELRIVAGQGNLRGDWADAHAAGYEVRWRRAGEADHTELTVPPEVQLDGLTNGATYTVGVRTDFTVS